MELREAIYKRRSIRRFKREHIDEKEIIELIRIANMAPSAGNLQSRDFIIIRDKGIKEALAEASLNQRFIAEAPWVVAVIGNEKKAERYGKRGKSLYTIQDSAASIMLLMLAAYEKGFGTCWIGAFDEDRVSEILELPEYARALAIIPIGYPDESPKTPDRYRVEEIIHRERW